MRGHPPCHPPGESPAACSQHSNRCLTVSSMTASDNYEVYDTNTQCEDEIFCFSNCSQRLKVPPLFCSVTLHSLAASTGSHSSVLRSNRPSKFWFGCVPKHDRSHLVRPVIHSFFTGGHLSWVCMLGGAVGGYWKGAHKSRNLWSQGSFTVDLRQIYRYIIIYIYTGTL